MTLQVRLGRITVKGSLNLFVGLVISNILLAVGAILIARLLGSDGYGLYALSAVPATFLGLFIGFGTRNATIKYSAQYNHINEIEKLKRVLYSTVLFVAISSSVFAAICFSLSPWIASFLSRIDAQVLMAVYSVAIFGDALAVCSQSIFVGMEKTQYCSIVLIFQAALRTTLAPILITVGFGPFGAVAGYVVASVSSGILGILTVYFAIIRRLKFNPLKLEFKSSITMLVKYGFPLYLANLIVGFRIQIMNFLLALSAGNVLIGNYQVALNFNVLINFFAIPVSTVLFPAFSKIEFNFEQEALRKTYLSSVKYASLLIIPATTALIVLSSQIVSILYGTSYSLAPLYLSLNALAFLYTPFGQYSIVALLNGQGETKKSMILSLANTLVGLLLALVLIPRFQTVGLIVSMVVSASPTVILGSLWVKKMYNISIDLIQALGILLCSSLAGVTAFAAITYLQLSNVLGMLIGFSILLFSFMLFSTLAGVVNLDDVHNLRAISSELGIASKVLKVPLRILSMFCKMAERTKRNLRNVN